ncbi:DUF2953 domain-containing protein [Alkalicella caledoniensis]|uniref:DUF2953 domain-containing protein n=1 Tax=Alkalicella caledoniensis TaxID=2731377 RepID=A0A7G9WC07_ALKCA|nr:DUF2953 domain-containing protein [Alkalicella caledoniensis]QNO16219.1 DUF2953 domain-containing protein [Alkalicella caledoniensis]
MRVGVEVSVYWFIPPVLWLIVMVSPVTLNVQVKKRGKDERIDVGVRLFWGLIHFDLDVPKILFRKNSIQAETELEQSHKKPYVDKKIKFPLNFKLFLEMVCELIVKKNEILKKLKLFQKISKRIVKLEYFNWETEYGLDDAALTGVVYGFIWQGKSALLFIMNKMMKFKCKPKIKLFPEFNRYVFKTELNCIFKLRVGYIIIISMFFLTMVLKYKISKKLGGGKGVRASNSRVNENGNGKHQGDGRC